MELSNSENNTPDKEESEIAQSPERAIAAAGAESEAVSVDASKFVDEDTDRPIADNKKMPTFNPDRPDDPTAGDGGGKKRGRPKLTPEQKAANAIARAAVKASPNFSDINRGGSTIPLVPVKARNYEAEFLTIFIPVSMTAGKFLGPQFGLDVSRQGENIAINLTDEQKQYIHQMARWIEYEQFPELNPRWGAGLASVAYWLPKFKQDPTPSRIKIAWYKCKIIWYSITGKDKKDVEKKIEEIQKKQEKPDEKPHNY